MIRYQVRSKELIDLVNEIKSKRLILSPYFQRNLVWRETHKIDFIKTILMGLPFPQIFIAKGSIDLETMTTTSCIVDGQQRMTTIVEYVSNKIRVDGNLFTELAPELREEILKYQIPIIDLDINNEAPEIKEIFQRLNRTFYSLNSIEKLSSEYASSEFMLFAKHLTGEITFKNDDEEEELPLQIDPTIPAEFIEWANANDAVYFKKLLVEGPIFTPYELSRQTHLMYAINLMATYLGGFYGRNELAIRCLNEFKESLENKDELLSNLENTAKFILDLDIDDNSYWYNKANIFSLFSYFSRNQNQINADKIPAYKTILEEFEAAIPADYLLAAKEAVNGRQQRLLRNDHLKNILENV